MSKTKKGTYNIDTQQSNPFYENRATPKAPKGPYNPNVQQQNAQYEGPAIKPEGKGAYNADTQQLNRQWEIQAAPKQKEKSLGKYGPSKNRNNWDGHSY